MKNGVVLGIYVLVLAITACQRPSLSDYQSTVRSLKEPITVTHAEPYLDFGSWGFTIEDANGKELSFCVQAVTAEDTTRSVGLLFPIGFLHIGSDNWQGGESIPVAPGSTLETQLMALMRNWTVERFPTWSIHTPEVWGGRIGAGDTAIAHAFISAVSEIERRDAVLKGARFPGW
jgi:hypothetical protein